MNFCLICEMPQHSGSCDREVLKKLVVHLREGLRVRTAELDATKKFPGKGVVMVRSLISHRTQKPRIDIQVGEIHTQMDADSAMDLAKNLIECSTGAYADAFVFHFITEKLEIAPAVGAQIIEEFRTYREDLADEFRNLQADTKDGKE